MDRARAFGTVRDIFMTIGNNLCDEGALNQQRDIFYLSVEEICSFILGSSVTDSLQWIVEKRKNDMASCSLFNPRERIMLQGTAYINHIPQVIRDEMNSDNLSGIGCCAGRVTGEAAVINDIRQARNTEGKILVAPMTDPGWVFLMITARGLIVERGSMLSHTAIIGRELGIPTIVGVKNAAGIIKNGQTISMDGHSGEIIIHDQEGM